MRTELYLAGALAIGLSPLAATAAPAVAYPEPVEHDWIARDFHFQTGEVMTELRLHYTTIGDTSGAPVLILHGTGGSGRGMLTEAFAGALFGPGQPLDARRYFIILPDAIGAGLSARPSDGLRASFPHYDYDDMVRAQYRLVTEGLGLGHLRLVLGNSMGGMLAWIWGETYPGFMDALVPMACQPAAMSGRNWMLRRMLIETIRQDPQWQGGDYRTEPGGLRLARTFFEIATSGGTLHYQDAAPSRAQADALVAERLAADSPVDANDYLYQWDASRNYDPSAGLERIAAEVLAINSADDERNPPETGIMERAMARVRGGRLFLIPASSRTRGHGTTAIAGFWSGELAALLGRGP